MLNSSQPQKINNVQGLQGGMNYKSQALNKASGLDKNYAQEGEQFMAMLRQSAQLQLDELNRQRQQSQQEYDPTGKTPEQIMAETGRQSELDVWGSTPREQAYRQGTFTPQEMHTVNLEQQKAQQFWQDQEKKQNIFAGSTDQPANISTEYGPAYSDPSGSLYSTSETKLPQRMKIDFKGYTEQAPNVSTEYGPAYGDANGNYFKTKESENPLQRAIIKDKVEVTQPFGNYNPQLEPGSGYNMGTDFATKVNTPIAVPPGKWEVVEAYGDDKYKGYVGNFGSNGGWGNSVLVRNADTGEMMRFSHLNKVNVQPGSIINGGTQIGLSGQTGNVTGPHLDLEYVNSNGQYDNILNSRYKNYLFGS